jgi:carbonic anhydrase
MSSRRHFIKSVAATGLFLGSYGPLALADIAAMTAKVQSSITPDQALRMFKEGNQRFVEGKMLERDLMGQVKATASGQFPFAVVVGCIDSRVPPEMVFDQGIGDIFSARVAGNFVNTDIIGSVEFATKLAGAKLVVVLGHTECGAIKGACDNAQMGNLTATLSNIAPAVYSVTDVSGERTSSNPKFVRRVADANVRLNVQALKMRSPILRGLTEQRQLGIVGAMHDVTTGRVNFFS